MDRVFKLIQKEQERQNSTIELIASENFVSENVLKAAGSCLTNKYAEGYPGRRYYGGCEVVDELEEYCRQKWQQVFATDYHVNVQPLSGTHANMTAYAALLRPGDTILSLDLQMGGHISHGLPISMTGKLYNIEHYGLDGRGYIDMGSVEDMAKKTRPKLIIAGASAYSRIIDFERFACIAHENGALLMADIAHIAGLVAAGEHPSPFGHADIVTTTTHKTLRGPRGGMILCKKEFANAIDKAIFPGTQGGPLMHIIAAKAVCFEEAQKPEFKAYQQRIIDNAKALERSLKAEGVRLVSGGTDNHLLLLDLGSDGLTGKEVEQLLDRANITVNKNSVPNETRKPTVTSGIRVGTPAATTRGLNEDDFVLVGRLIADIIKNGEEAVERVADKVREITDKYPLYPGE